jgi:two-component system, NarL family, nitrate/nitrite response regulator NarL
VDPDPVRVLIVEDDDTFAMALQLLIDREPDFEVVGRARDGDEAFTLAIALRPWIVTMDVEMPGTGGIEATRMIAEYLPGARIVIVSGASDRSIEAIDAGAAANVPKYDVVERLVPVLRTLVPH